MATQSGADYGKKRTVLKDSSWIKRAAEEDEPVDYDPNFGKAVLGRLKSTDDADSKPVETNQTPPVKSGTPVNSLTKKFGGSQDLLNKSSITTTKTKTTVNTSTTPSKPPVPAKNPALKTSPNPSSFTARVFSGANTNNKTLSPVKRSFGEKFPDVTVSHTANGPDKTTSTGPSSPAPTAAVVPPSSSSSSSPEPSTKVTSAHTVKSAVITTPVSQPAVKISTRNETVPLSTKSSVPGSPAPQTAPEPSSPAPSTTFNTSTIVKSTTPVIQPAEKSSTRNESTYSSLTTSTSSKTSAKTTITDVQTSSVLLEETRTVKPSERYSQSSKLSDVSASSTYTSPSAVTVNTRKGSSYSAPLDDLADTLFPTSSGTVQSQSQVKFIDNQSPAPSQTLYSPAQTTLIQNNRSVSSRDVCTVCGKAIAGAPRMILEELKFLCHTTCFRCAVCNCILGNLEAGKSLWVHRDRVNCLTCYSKIKGQWYA